MVPVPFETQAVPFTDWVGHTITAQLMARSIRHLKNVLRRDNSDPASSQQVIRKYALDQLQLSSALIDLEKFSSLCRDAWVAGFRRDATDDQKERVFNQASSLRCYLCGESTSEDPGPLFRTVDHLWPASLGGDTCDENLALCCKLCNDSRSDLYGWPWGPVHRYFRRPDSLSMDRNSRWLWIPIHLRAIMLQASQAGTSLKEAAEHVGARDDWRSEDANDIAHFFNLRTTSGTS